MPKRNTPGRCVCCSQPACTRCIRVLGCPGTTGAATPLPGATVTLSYVDPNTGAVTTFGPGITNSVGEVCIEVPGLYRYGEIRYSISASGFVTKSGKLDYTQQCGKISDVRMTPGSDAGGGTSGRLTVTLVDESGVPVTSGTAYVVDPLDPLNFTNSATMGAGGVVTFTGVATNTNRFFRGPNLQNFPTFQIACEGTASAKYAFLGVGQQWSLSQVACGSACLVCCAACAASVPCTLTLDDPQQLDPWVAIDSLGSCRVTTAGILGAPTPSPAGCADRGSSSVTLTRTAFDATWTRTGPVRYEFSCTTTGGAILDVYAPCLWVGSTLANGDICATWETPFLGGWLVKTAEAWRVVASSVTCSPFTATFSLPARTITLYRRYCNFTGCFVEPCGTCVIPARTITVTE